MQVSPWKSPLEGVKVDKGVPLIMMDNKVDEVGSMIQFVHIGMNRNERRVICMYCCLSLSKTLDASSFKSVPGFLVTLREWI